MTGFIVSLLISVDILNLDVSNSILGYVYVVRLSQVCNAVLWEFSWQLINEPMHGKTNTLGFKPGPTLAKLYCMHRKKLKA